MDDQPPRNYVPPPAAPSFPARSEVREEIRPGEPVPVEHPLSEPPQFDAPPPRRSGHRRLLWLLILALIVGAVVWWVMRHHQTASTGRFTSTGPMPVGTATVQKGDMPIVDNALGTVTPLATVTVQTQINGQLIDVGFQEGQMVKKGDFLAQIDPRPYQVALEQAQGQLAKDQAALADAQLDLARYQKLVAQNSIAKQTADTQAATVAQDRGAVQTDQAQVDAQKLNLAYCHIIAPLTGRVGLRQIDPGNYVQTSSTTGIVVITQLQPISVIFTLPEDSLPAVLKQVHAGQTLKATAFDRSGATQIEVGQLATLDNQIDTTTGTLKLRATFANGEVNLFPNQFVNIKLQVDTMRGANLVPSAAVQRGAPGTFVYVVKPDDTVTAQPVTLGPDDGQNVAVTKGLEPGQVVVTDGADRLKEGAKITVTESGTQPNGQPAVKVPGQGQGQGQGRGQGHSQGQAPGQSSTQGPGQPPTPSQAPGGQAPGGQAPGGQAPGGQAPGGQAPGGQAPGGQTNGSSGG
ncbi:MAG TPA: MdtA/MuxA family multidrug efflux RND transporter periplasmic adaptor subunit [Stellaceae bacterium]|nr:MdtA/MuxA family multidrug efflux RND transporter periplasmic adaptor subunit [Stellaceae bacterium]